MPKIFLADVLLRADRQDELASLLREVSAVLRSFKRIFAQIPKGRGEEQGEVAPGVEPDVFYDVHRPLWELLGIRKVIQKRLDGFHPHGVPMEAGALCGMQACFSLP